MAALAQSQSLPSLTTLPHQTSVSSVSTYVSPAKKRPLPGLKGSLPVLLLPRTRDRQVGNYGHLLLDIGTMRLGDVDNFTAEIPKVEGYGAGAKVRHAFRTRVAELVCDVSPQNLARATEALLALHSVDDIALQEAVEREIPGAKPVAPSRLSPLQDPYRGLEERIGKLAFAGRDDLHVLEACLVSATRLGDAHLIRSQIREAVAGCLLRWVEETPLNEVRKRLPVLCRLGELQPPMMAALEQRLVRRANRGFPEKGQLSGFIKFLLELQEGGLRFFDGPGVPMLDPPSISYLPPLRLAVLDAVRGMLLRWNITRLAEEFNGPILRFCAEFPKDVKPQVCLAVSQRAVLDLEALSEQVRREGNCIRLQEDMIRWATFAIAAASEDLLRPGLLSMQQLLSGAVTYGSIAFVTAAVTPGCPEMPAGFKGKSAELAKRSSEMMDLLAEVKRHLLGSPGPADPPQFEEDVMSEAILDMDIPARKTF